MNKDFKKGFSIGSGLIVGAISIPLIIFVGWYVLGYGLLVLQKKEYKNYETCKVRTLLSHSGLIREDLPTITEEEKLLDIDEYQLKKCGSKPNKYIWQ